MGLSEWDRKEWAKVYQGIPRNSYSGGEKNENDHQPLDFVSEFHPFC